MPTFSDGGDRVDAVISPSHTLSSAGDMRLHLQTILDNKEKQLQQAGTLGQQLLAQRMELEERIRQLQELDLDAGDDDMDSGIRERYRELADTIKAWDSENEQFSNLLDVKQHASGAHLSPELARSDPERSLERSKVSVIGPSAAQSSRRTKNAAHRADDVEFAFEIGTGLLTEVRRLQSLLGERDKAIQDIKEEKDDLEKTVESLRAALLEQEQSADKFKEENWNLEVTMQEQRVQLNESQATVQRLEGEHKRLAKQLTAARELADHHKNEAERHQNSFVELKAKHDTDVAQARKNAASLQRDKSDLQQTLDSMKAEVARASRRLPRFGSPFTPNGTVPSEAVTPGDFGEDDVFSTTGGASTNNRKRIDNSLLLATPGSEFGDSSPEPSPSRLFLSPSHPNNEVEALQQRLAHAQRQIQTLKGTLQREKELRMEYRRKLDASPGYSIDEEEEDFVDADQQISKSKPRVTPYRPGRGRGRGRGKGRGGLTLIQRLGMAANSPSSEYNDDDDFGRDDSPIPPVPSVPLNFRSDEDSPDEIEPRPPSMDEDQDDNDVQNSPSPQVRSNRTSVDGMDPAFANVLRRSTSSSSLVRQNSSPLRQSIMARTRRGGTFPRRSRGGAAFQEARPPSLVAQPDSLAALAAELGNFGMGESFETVEDLTIQHPTPKVETAEFACQTDFEEPAPPVVEPLSLPPIIVAPTMADMGIQVELEPTPVVATVEVSLQTEEEAVPARSEFGVQHVTEEPIVTPVIAEPEPVLITHTFANAEVQTAEEPIIPLSVPEPEPVPVVTHTFASVEVQTHSAQSVDVNIQTIAEPIPVPLKMVDADVQVQPPPSPATFEAETQTQLPVVTHVEIQAVQVDVVDMQTQSSLPVTSEAETQTKVPLLMDAEIQADVPQPIRIIEPSFSDVSVGDDSGDTTISAAHPFAVVVAERMTGPGFEDDDTETETGSVLDHVSDGETASMMETDTDDYEDARQSIPPTTPSESEDYHSMMTVTDNDFSESDDDESIKASRLPSRQRLSRTSSLHSVLTPETVASTSYHTPLGHTYEDKAVSADILVEPVPEDPKIEEILPPVSVLKPELKEMAIQTDEWIPPTATPAPPFVPLPVLASATSSVPPSPAPAASPALYRVGPNSHQFQFISPPPSAGPSTANLPSLVPQSPNTTVRDSSAIFIPRPRTSHSDRRQSIESNITSAIDDVIARSRTPSNVTAAVDKSRPPMMVLPPPPRQPPPPNSMLPPPFIPERKINTMHDHPPPRPSSPPPVELIQRATTPTLGAVLSVPGQRGSVLRPHGSSMPPSQQGLRQPPSTSSFRSAANAAARAYSPSAMSFSIREHERRELSTTSLTSGGHSLGSQHSSLSSDHHLYENASQRLPNRPETPQRNGNGGLSANGGVGSTDPTIIHAITQTMIGEFLYKYTRRTIGKGHGERRHKRFFWVHPYTKTLYWSSADPGSSNVSESSAKSAYIEAVRSVLDPNPMPPGIHQYSVIVSTPQREMKFTAPTKERHDIWINALNYLLTRPSAMAVPSPGNTQHAPLSPLSMNADLPDDDHAPRPNIMASPESHRSARTAMSADSWTPRGQRSQSQLSLGGSVGKRSGTPAAEYLRWMGTEGPQSPGKSFEHIPGGDDEDLDFELHEETLSDDGYEGLENVRACCDGRHTVGGRHHHHHHHSHDHPPREVSRTRDQHLDARVEHSRPVSPSAWSFRSRAGSTASHEGGTSGFFSRFGSKRSTKTVPGILVGAQDQ